jgi:hypothetical protein
LQPLLKLRFVALVQDRLFVMESDRPLYPDVSILRTQSPLLNPGATALMEADAPALFELWRENIREPLIHIIEPAANNRVVTAIEVPSPDNKQPGPGRQSYLRKRDELWDNTTNLVEIDLLCEGEATVRVSDEHLDTLRPFHYVVAVTRCWPSRHEVCAIALARRLPRVAIPLMPEDRDVVLDLQACFTRCWDEGPYPELLRYQEGPPGRLSAEEISWCEGLLREAGYRKDRQS